MRNKLYFFKVSVQPSLKGFFGTKKTQKTSNVGKVRKNDEEKVLFSVEEKTFSSF